MAPNTAAYCFEHRVSTALIDITNNVVRRNGARTTVERLVRDQPDKLAASSPPLRMQCRHGSVTRAMGRNAPDCPTVSTEFLIPKHTRRENKPKPRFLRSYGGFSPLSSEQRRYQEMSGPKPEKKPGGRKAGKRSHKAGATAEVRNRSDCRARSQSDCGARSQRNCRGPEPSCNRRARSQRNCRARASATAEPEPVQPLSPEPEHR